MANEQQSVLGIDPGYGRMGYAVVVGRGDDATLATVGCIETHAAQEHPARLNEIANGVRRLIEEYRPDTLAIEKLFFSKNQTTALAVAESRGVVLAVAGAFGMRVIELGPRQVKQALTGHGAAKKDQVHDMTLRFLKRSEPIKPDDAADAAAIALTGLYKRK